jgi:hypothetical protein
VGCCAFTASGHAAENSDELASSHLTPDNRANARRGLVTPSRRSDPSICIGILDVCYWGYCGLVLLTMSLSGFDPEPPWAVKSFCIAILLARRLSVASQPRGFGWSRAAGIGRVRWWLQHKGTRVGKMRLRMCVHELRGVMTTLMRNDRDRRSEKPVWADAILKRLQLSGTDQRITSGPAAIAAAS